MRINKKLIKGNRGVIKNFIDKKEITNNKIIPFSIVITYSSNRIEQLKDCLFYLNQCIGINSCEIILVQYQNVYQEQDFSDFKNLSINHYWSMRNNAENKFCLSHARNIGLYRVKHTWTLMLDADVIVPPDMCRLLSDTWVRNSVSKMYICYRANIPSHLNHASIDEIKKNILFLDTCFSGFWHFFNTNFIKENIGGYDEKMAGFGREDCDMIMRFGMSGGKIYNMNSFIEVYHIPHDYDPIEWKTKDSDQINHIQQDENRKNKKLKMVNIGNIIS